MEGIIGPSGSECYRLTHESGAEVTIALQGGHIVSWKTADGCERIYLSPQADFSIGRAIRGGVPVIFPQFSDHGPFGRHGFARRAVWIPDLEHGAMTLSSTDETLAEWPHPFELSLRPVLSASALDIELTVTNPGPDPISFQAALHTYLWVREFDKTTITGLEGKTYQDETTRETDTDDHPITLGSETDRAYFGAATQSILLRDGTTEIAVDSESFGDAVIWNPGPDHGIGDLPTDGWRQFVCIESAQIDPGVIVEPGRSWRGVQRLAAPYPIPVPTGL